MVAAKGVLGGTGSGNASFAHGCPVPVPNMRRIAWAWDGHAAPNRLMMRRADSPKVLDPRMPGLSVPCFITRLDCGLP